MGGTVSARPHLNPSTASSWLLTCYFPTHDDEAVMNGAPGVLVLGEGAAEAEVAVGAGDVAGDLGPEGVG
jgi:hypothetical protein